MKLTPGRCCRGSEARVPASAPGPSPAATGAADHGLQSDATVHILRGF